MRGLLITGFIAICLTGCVNVFKIMDLQPKEGIVQTNEEFAKELIYQMGQAHGVENWANLDTYSLKLTDEWCGLMGKMASPYKDRLVNLSIDYIHGTNDGRMRFIGGKSNHDIWGLQSWHAYKTIDDEINFKKDKKTEFMLPTYQYFLELPLRIQEATNLAHVGSKVIDEILCEGVIASWGTIEPQKNIDQYVLWINSENKMLVQVDYTVRDAYKFVSGSTSYRDYESFRGLKIAMDMPVRSNMVKNGLLHHMKILQFNANVVPKAFMRPKENLELSPRYIK